MAFRPLKKKGKKDIMEKREEIRCLKGRGDVAAHWKKTEKSRRVLVADDSL